MTSRDDLFTCTCGTRWTADGCCGPCPSCGSRDASDQQDAENCPDDWEPMP